ncbi:sphingosine 1-phosphate receptor 3-like, partial [Sinocyclocheilus rhinocerous]|uniref:sphingosine 1-phosphate receptor 3-like n=1 Tax=Sinocyclocheilus rhinocerous TaxID=307959 RepID=UPI0007B81D3D
LPQCSTILPLYSKSYVAFCITIFISLLLAIFVLYARIYALVKSSSRKVTKHSNCERSMALLRTVSIVVGVFITCWTPIFVLLLVDVACGNKMCPVLLKADWFVALAVLNSAMNPVIYTLAS